MYTYVHNSKNKEKKLLLDFYVKETNKSSAVWSPSSCFGAGVFPPCIEVLWQILGARPISKPNMEKILENLAINFGINHPSQYDFHLFYFCLPNAGTICCSILTYIWVQRSGIPPSIYRIEPQVLCWDIEGPAKHWFRDFFCWASFSSQISGKKNKKTFGMCFWLHVSLIFRKKNHSAPIMHMNCALPMCVGLFGLTEQIVHGHFSTGLGAKSFPNHRNVWSNPKTVRQNNLFISFPRNQRVQLLLQMQTLYIN